MIFESKERSVVKHILRGEPVFDFYDRVGGKAFDAYREIVNSLVSRVPEEAAQDVIGRMRSRDDLHYDTALAELIIYETFHRLSFSLTFHPQVNGSTKLPDFLITDSGGNQVSYLEVTTINPPATEVGCNKREGAVFYSLNRVKMAEDLRLVYSVKSFGAESPSINKLCQAVRQWTEKHADAARSQKYIQKDFQVDDWCFDLSLVGGASERPGARRIVMWGDVSGAIVGQMKLGHGLKKGGYVGKCRNRVYSHGTLL